MNTGTKSAAQECQTAYFLGGEAVVVKKARPILDPHLAPPLQQPSHLKVTYAEGMDAGWTEDDSIGLVRFLGK